jgi:hypothetical protein
LPVGVNTYSIFEFQTVFLSGLRWNFQNSIVAQRDIISPLEALLDHLWATLFHLLLRMGKGWLFGKLSRGREYQLKNTLIEIGSQGKNGGNLTISK